MAAKTSAVALNLSIVLRRLEIEIALREHAERGGQIFSAEIDVDAAGEPVAHLKMVSAAIDGAIVHVIGQRGLVADTIKWSVDAEGVFCKVDVTPKARKPRGPNKAKTPPVAPTAAEG